MFIFRQITADPNGIVNTILYSTRENEKIENRDKWLTYEIPVNQRIAWNPEDPRIAELIMKSMDTINA